MTHHPGPDGRCQGCIDKLKQANPIFTPWFWKWRVKFPDLHISWTFRDEVSQNAAFASGKSKLPWPKSAHNRMVAGTPESNAVDLFEIFDGKPLWRPSVMHYIAEGSPELVWGGNFKGLADYDHYQVADDSSQLVKASHPEGARKVT